MEQRGERRVELGKMFENIGRGDHGEPVLHDILVAKVSLDKPDVGQPQGVHDTCGGADNEVDQHDPIEFLRQGRQESAAAAAEVQAQCS